MDGHDVRVLEPGEGLRLARPAPRHLQGDGPIGQLALPRQEDPGERPATQLLDQEETRDGLAHLRERTHVLARAGPRQQQPSLRRARADQPVDLQDPAQRRLDLREAGEELGRVGPLAVVLAEAELLVDQRDDRVLAEVGMPVDVPAGPELLAGLPAERQVGAEQGQPRAGAVDRQAGRVEERLGIRPAGAVLGVAPGSRIVAGQADRGG